MFHFKLLCSFSHFLIVPGFRSFIAEMTIFVRQLGRSECLVVFAPCVSGIEMVDLQFACFPEA